jgi:hypothetical protein
MDGGEKSERFVAPAPTYPKRGKILRGAQFKGSSVLSSRCLKGAVE